MGRCAAPTARLRLGLRGFEPMEIDIPLEVERASYVWLVCFAATSWVEFNERQRKAVGTIVWDLAGKGPAEKCRFLSKHRQNF